ncbi:ATP-binding protein [Campylobacter canadensis]|uniref:ATP-binding protein n=1 Tax=Campylobacter canadensis TaxID=449520 RepID=A0ABS7WRG8_9BACT|nr:ATP-binding protein [Campylobacter canadensis]MBZ7987326.1 ATP-binding protein [Campylobacter canadensis]MBZ7994791.1 ATP-binding protein [Campylobacter canadensis]MBZ7996501.1 ATP-binding protein [Campylobacter canadensis]MBZ7998503.1 ATP-binding protein [Campylobacter canadensis]MBZ8000218.1 ATP-binding protein [Campylobacter canadensis]
MSNKYTYAKELFIDNLASFNFINLDKSKITYHRIISALSKPLKLILFYGKPGSGKTFILTKVENDLKKQDKKIIFFPQPFYSEKEFFSTLFYEINKEEKEILSYESFLKNYKELLVVSEEEAKKEPFLIMLDEAQLYPQILIEKIRLLADTKLFRFLFTVHKTSVGEEDVLAQEHFTTRIWESIELVESTQSEVITYIEKKLDSLSDKLGNNFFVKKDYDFIYKLTKGNLRTVNLLLYKAFEIYEFYEQEKSSEFANANINEKVLTMSAISQRLINA